MWLAISPSKTPTPPAVCGFDPYSVTLERLERMEGLLISMRSSSFHRGALEGRRRRQRRRHIDTQGIVWKNLVENAPTP